MGWGRWMAPVAMTAFVIVASAGKAGAQLDGDDGCHGSGTFVNDGLEVDAEGIKDQLVEIPRSDVVDWQGSVNAPPGKYSGSIGVDLPPPFGEVEIDSWSGNSQNTGNSGSRDYDFPSIVPAGVEFQVVGGHTDENGSCDGFVNVEIKGGPFDGPLAPASLVATAGVGVGLFFTARSLFKGSPA